MVVHELVKGLHHLPCVTFVVGSLLFKFPDHVLSYLRWRFLRSLLDLPAQKPRSFLQALRDQVGVLEI